MRITRNRAREARLVFRITPMIDIVFLLVIFFMCVAEMRRMETEAVTLPVALSAKERSLGSPRLVVNVLRSGECRVAGRIRSPRALGRLVAARAVRQQDAEGLSALAVKIRADAGVPYKYVQRVMLACREARVWRLSFAAAPAEKR